MKGRDHSWRGAIVGGGEQSRLERSDSRERGAITGEREAITGGGERSYGRGLIIDRMFRQNTQFHRQIATPIIMMRKLFYSPNQKRPKVVTLIESHRIERTQEAANQKKERELQDAALAKASALTRQNAKQIFSDEGTASYNR